MLIRALTNCVTLTAVFLLGSCGGATDPGPAKLCNTIDQRTYYSAGLLELGRGPVDVNLGHWAVTFDKGEIRSLQSDFGLSGTYACVDGAVLAEIPIGTDTNLHVITFAENLQSLNYHPFNDKDLEYRYVSNAGQAVKDCEAVSKLNYSTEDNSLQIQFLNYPRADITIGRTTMEGYYNCQLGEMQIHRAAADTDPYRAQLLSNGDLVVQEGDREITLSNSGGPIDPPIDPPVCTKEYEPVCAAVEQIEPCLTLPCPKLVYKTFGNLCEAGGSDTIGEPLKGECGKREGTPVTQLDGVACLAIFDPVCAKTESNIVCVTEPCPSHAYRTTGNACSANVALDPVLFAGECGKLQDSFADGEPIAFVRDGLPKTQKNARVLSSEIKGDKLKVELGYSGCQAQHFELYVDASTALESFPIQRIWRFVPQVEDLCDAYFTTTFVYDLVSLRQLAAPEGTVVLNQLGTYTF